MRRREFFKVIGGGAIAARPFAALAQPERVRRLGVLVGLAENDPEIKERIAGLRQGLEKLGWVEGSKLRIDYRFAAGRQCYGRDPIGGRSFAETFAIAARGASHGADLGSARQSS